MQSAVALRPTRNRPTVLTKVSEQSMSECTSVPTRARRKRRDWRSWVVRLALLCFVALHSIGLLHHHTTTAERAACVACQVVDHQASNVPQTGCALLVAFVVWLVLALPARPQLPRRTELFSRPPTRAPPFRSFS